MKYFCLLLDLGCKAILQMSLRWPPPSSNRRCRSTSWLFPQLLLCLTGHRHIPACTGGQEKSKVPKFADEAYIALPYSALCGAAGGQYRFNLVFFSSSLHTKSGVRQRSCWKDFRTTDSASSRPIRAQVTFLFVSENPRQELLEQTRFWFTHSKRVLLGF